MEITGKNILFIVGRDDTIDIFAGLDVFFDDLVSPLQIYIAEDNRFLAREHYFDGGLGITISNASCRGD
jgi:hypothetical protein